jgi:hypothetical protein
MSSSRVPRRAVLGAAVSASLVAGGLSIALAADAPGCATFADAKGDSRPEAVPNAPAQTAEDGLDLTAVTFDTAEDKLRATVKVVDLGAAPEYSAGDAFYARFKHGGKAIEVYAYRYNPTQIGTVLALDAPQVGLRVAGKTVPSKAAAAYDTKTETVVLTVPLADLEKGAAAPTAGASLTELSAEAAGDDIVLAEPWDTAAAPKDMAYAIGGVCGDAGGAPAPAASGAASAAPSAAPSTAPSAAPSAAPSSAPASGAPAAADGPAPDCVDIKDAKADGQVNATTNPATATSNDPDLDLLAVNFESTPDAIRAYLKVDKLGAKASTGNGHRFNVKFTAGTKAVEVYGGQPDAVAAASNGALVAAGQSAPASGGARIAGTYNAAVKTTAVFDVKNSRVVLTVDRPSLEKALAAPLADGEVVKATSAGSAVYTPTAGNIPADTAQAATAEEQVYTVGDNRCFAPPVPPLSSVGALTAQFGDSAAVAAKLVDAAGAPVAGKEVTFALGASKATATTGEDGVAKAVLLVNEKAGKRSLAITSGETSMSEDFTVMVEKTALKAAGSKGAVTATLTDDDRKAVAGQVVAFTSGSVKKTARTDAKGVAKAAGFPAGSTVTVTYAGAAGQYAGSKTSAKA